MTVQVLVSTMHQTDHSLLETMNIGSDAIVVNQCDRNEFEAFSFRGHAIRWLSLSERGVGLSRNTALQRANADIVLFADDDVTYVDEYIQLVKTAFLNNPDADVLVFNLLNNLNQPRKCHIQKKKRISRENFGRYGTPLIAGRLVPLQKSTISFSLLFGGGAPYSCGEDSLFLASCLRAGLRMYACPVEIGTVSYTESTWFQGYTDKYFTDKGALYDCLSPRLCRLYSLWFCIKHRAMFAKSKTPMEAYRLMLEGIRSFQAQR